MTSVALMSRRSAARQIGAVTRAETAMTGLALFLSMHAVAPLVFDWGATSAVVVQDPISQPAWSLVILFTLIVATRFHRDILAAASRNIPIIVICLLALLSTAWSSIELLTLQYAIELSVTTVLALYIGVRHGISRLVAITGWVMVVVLVLSTVFALVLPKYGIDPDQDGRWRGVFTTKNELGRLMVIGGMVWTVRTLSGETRRLGGALLVIAFAVVGYASGSRTALAVAVILVGVSLLAFPFPRRARQIVPIKGLIVSLLALALVVTYDSQGFLLDLVGADKNITGRTGIWSAAWSAFGEQPWFGYGFDAFWRGIEGPSLIVWQTSGVRTPHSHNGFLDLLLALGIAGLLACLAALAVVMRRSAVALREGLGSARVFPFVYLAFFILYNLTESSLVTRRSLEWILFVAVAAALPLRASERWASHDSGEPVAAVGPEAAG